MEAVPSDEQLHLARILGRRWGRRTPFGDADDGEQDAYVALLTEWPKLSALYPNGVPQGAISTCVRRRLIDRLRTQTGWRRVGGFLPPLYYEAFYEDGTWQPPGDNDTEVEAMHRISASVVVEDVIDDIVRASPDKQRERDRYILKRLAVGAVYMKIAVDLGITESRVCQIITRLRHQGRRLHAA